MKNKIKMNGVASDYSKLPNRIFELGLDIASIGIYSFFLSGSENFNPSPKQVTKKLGISRSLYYKRIKQLLDTNVINLVSRGYSFGDKCQSARYEFTNPKTWNPLSKDFASAKTSTGNFDDTDGNDS